MTEHVILGAGSIGTGIARRLTARGEAVRMITRSGSGPEHPLVERAAADASDASRLIELTRGAEVIYHAANPPSYTQWERMLPPIQTAVIAAAEAADAVLALTGSLYAYGPQPGGRMDERTPLTATGHKGRLRRRMWEQALAADIRAVEVRGSDYVGRDAVGLYALVIAPAFEKGRPAVIPGRLDMPHTFTSPGVGAGVARALGPRHHDPGARAALRGSPREAGAEADRAAAPRHARGGGRRPDGP
jgi:nucleoside-diphosphate-sugar epimerase